MTPEAREAFYDAEVAPLLLDLCSRCEARGMGFVAMVDYTGQGHVGRTMALPAEAPAILRYAHGIGECGLDRGNVDIDKFMFAIMREAWGRGHSSVVLSQLGVPMAPMPTPSVAKDSETV